MKLLYIGFLCTLHFILNYFGAVWIHLFSFSLLTLSWLVMPLLTVAWFVEQQNHKAINFPSFFIFSLPLSLYIYIFFFSFEMNFRHSLRRLTKSWSNKDIYLFHLLLFSFLLVVLRLEYMTSCLLAKALPLYDNQC